MLGFGYRFASRYRVLPGGKRFSPHSNSRRRASSRRQWFVPSPSSGDTAGRVFQNPYQPMVVRAGLALGPSCPRCFLSDKHGASNNSSELRDRGLGGWAVSIGATTTCAAARPLLSLIMRSSLANSSSVRLAVPCSSLLIKLPDLLTRSIFSWHRDCLF